MWAPCLPLKFMTNLTHKTLGISYFHVWISTKYELVKSIKKMTTYFSVPLSKINLT